MTDNVTNMLLAQRLMARLHPPETDVVPDQPLSGEIRERIRDFVRRLEGPPSWFRRMAGR